MSEHAVTVLDRGFALTIAFLLPGLVLLAGTATVNPTVATWFTGAQTGPTIVGFLFVVLAALAMSMVITAIRWSIFECAWLPGCPLIPPAPDVDLSQRKDVEAQYVDYRHQHYYYYLAHANTAVAVPLAVVAWLAVNVVTAPWWLSVSIVACTAIVSGVLGAAACDAINRYDQRLRRLLQSSATVS